MRDASVETLWRHCRTRIARIPGFIAVDNMEASDLCVRALTRVAAVCRVNTARHGENYWWFKEHQIEFALTAIARTWFYRSSFCSNSGFRGAGSRPSTKDNSDFDAWFAKFIECSGMPTAVVSKKNTAVSDALGCLRRIILDPAAPSIGMEAACQRVSITTANATLADPPLSLATLLSEHDDGSRVGPGFEELVTATSYVMLEGHTKQAERDRISASPALNIEFKDFLRSQDSMVYTRPPPH